MAISGEHRSDMSMSDAFLPEGPRGNTAHDDALDREDVDLDAEAGADHLSDDVAGARGPHADDAGDGEPPARATSFRPPTGTSVDPADD